MCQLAPDGVFTVLTKQLRAPLLLSKVPQFGANKQYDHYITLERGQG